MNQTTQAVWLVRGLSLVVALLALAALWEAFLGHYRSGFPLKAQYAPLGSAGILTAAAAVGVAVPARADIVLQLAGWLAIITGLVGVGYHHYYGIVEKPAGYRWLLHHVMYHAPPLAPLVLTALGALALLAGLVAHARARAFGMSIDSAVLLVCAMTMLGASVQAGILHFRGAFNNALMYVPVTIPLAAVAALAWQWRAPSELAFHAAVATLWLTFVSGFLGFGMHLRGIDREMGGLYLPRENLLQGPPVFAPLTFAGFAGAALVVLYLR